MKKTVEAILGFEVVEVEVVRGLELIDNSAEYNKEMNVSVESLNDEKTYYVTVLNRDTWEFEGYYQAK